MVELLVALLTPGIKLMMYTALFRLMYDIVIDAFKGY